MSENFGDKLKLLLKVLVISRSGLASALNVDKSLVGRWAAGTVRPSEHNLAKITRFVAESFPGFTVLHWDRDLDDLAEFLGVEQPKPKSNGLDYLFPPSLLEEAQRTMPKRAKAYEGLWRTTRPSNDLPGRFVRDICMTFQRSDGTLSFQIGVEGVRYQGWSILLQHQLFSMAWDAESSAMIFSILNGVARQKPQVIDGINLATLRDAGGSPAASACIMERIGEIGPDPDQNTAMFERAIAELNPLVPEGEISDELADHLNRKVIDGPPGIFRMIYGQSMARGSRLGG